ncbi:hypothetical protein E2C01_030068 [Portunus trituberculatus]|uniref:Uncharacterized protein n=1 Tax=Portunus trituberculatus TaxID=210409 RepID=A0A5B7ET86_PORTR|nr:hypothetical protein [Portunus trituberculatus]
MVQEQKYDLRQSSWSDGVSQGGGRGGDGEGDIGISVEVDGCVGGFVAVVSLRTVVMVGSDGGTAVSVLWHHAAHIDKLMDLTRASSETLPSESIAVSCLTRLAATILQLQPVTGFSRILPRNPSDGVQRPVATLPEPDHATASCFFSFVEEGRMSTFCAQRVLVARVPCSHVLLLRRYNHLTMPRSGLCR